MEDNMLIEKLIKFGLTRQEAAIYLCLASNHDISGYEVSKITGISRSNVYNSLSSLVEEGAAYLLEGDTNKYMAVEIEQFCDNKIRHLNETKEELIQAMPKMGNICEGYITINNHKNIMDRVHYIINHAQYRIYLSMPVKYIEQCREDIEGLIKDGKKVVLLVNEPVKFDGSIVYISERDEQQIRLIADSEYVLTGDMTGSASDSCLYCGQKNFVNVFKESMKNEIKLIELTQNK